MNRRHFIQAFAGAVATVAIGMRVSKGMPEALEDGYAYKTVRLNYTIVSEEVEEGLYGEIGERYARALAQSMMQTKEVVASNRFNRAFG